MSNNCQSILSVFLVSCLLLAIGSITLEKRYKQLHPVKKPPVVIKKIIKTKAELLLEESNKKKDEANRKKAAELTHEKEILTYCSDREYAFRQNYKQTEICIINYVKAEKLIKKLRKGVE